MKKTLLITLDFLPAHGGIANYWKHLLMVCDWRDVVVLAPAAPGALKADRSLPFRVVRRRLFSTWSYPRWFPLLVHAWLLIKREKIDVVIAAQILPCGTVAYLLSRFFHIPYIISVHGMDIKMSLQSKRKKVLSTRIIRCAAGIIANSHATQKLLSRYNTPIKRCEVVYPCPSIAPWRSLPHITTVDDLLERAHPLMLSVGRLVRRKGCDMGIRAVSNVTREFPRMHYVIIGEGEARQELEELVYVLGVEDRVHLLGMLADDIIAQWYERCDLFVLPVRERDDDVEGFGMVYLEAASFGKPVIGTRSGGVSEAVVDGETGILVARDDQKAFEAALQTLCRDPDLRAKLGEQGRARVKNDFQWQVQAGTLARLIDSCTI